MLGEKKTLAAFKVWAVLQVGIMKGDNGPRSEHCQNTRRPDSTEARNTRVGLNVVSRCPFEAVVIELTIEFPGASD